MDLVVMAAGMGSRFGGLKQIEPIDKQGNFIIDYSVFDAIRAGFEKIVFVIKRENYIDFKDTIGKRIEKYIKVEYAFQDLDSYVPSNIKIENRIKPWGTAHAILCAKDKVKGPFAVINADDFYGRGSILSIAEFLKKRKNDDDIAMVGFKVINTITDNGTVKRGICKSIDGNLKNIEENEIKKENNKLFATPIGKNQYVEIAPDTLVSMNMFGFTKNVFDYLEKGFNTFLEANKNDLATCEYFIPTILTQYINENKGKMKLIDTNEKWYGLTYKADFNDVFDGINSLVKMGIYPDVLWN